MGQTTYDVRRREPRRGDVAVLSAGGQGRSPTSRISRCCPSSIPRTSACTWTRSTTPPRCVGRRFGSGSAPVPLRPCRTAPRCATCSSSSSPTRGRDGSCTRASSSRTSSNSSCGIRRSSSTVFLGSTMNGVIFVTRFSIRAVSLKGFPTSKLIRQLARLLRVLLHKAPRRLPAAMKMRR